MKYFKIVYFTIILLICLNNTSGKCPEKCLCKKTREGTELQGWKIICGGTPANKILSFNELDFGEIVGEVTQL